MRKEKKRKREKEKRSKKIDCWPEKNQEKIRDDENYT